MRRRAGFVILLLLFVAAAGVAIARRGPWYDEFYSFYLVRPDAPVGVLAPAWLRDNHPPLFYGLAWAWARLLGLAGLAGTVQALRTINLVALGMAVTAFVQLARADPWFRRLVWPYALALAALFPALDRIDQLRSYFLSLVLTALVVPLLARLITRDHGRTNPVMLGVVLALAFSVHMVTTVIVAGLTAATGAHLLMARRWHDAWRLVLTAALALIPFALAMLLQLSTIVANTRTFWIPPGWNAARWAIESELSGAVLANPLLTACGAAGICLLVVSARAGDGASRATLSVIATLGTAIMLALAVLVYAHLHRPLLITRYLVALDPVVAFMLALAAEHALRQMPRRAGGWIDLGLLLGTALALQTNLATTVRQWSWNGTSATIAAQVRRCPDTLIYPDMQWNGEVLNSTPRDNAQVLPFAYATMARRYGFALAPAGSRRLSPTCPTLFWTEHVAGLHPDATTVLRALRTAGYPVRSGRMARSDIGWVLITPPAPANQAGRQSRTTASNSST
jgi:hypothetical protein